MINIGSINTDISSPARPEPTEAPTDNSRKARLSPDNSNKFDSETKGQNPSGTNNPQELSSEEILVLSELKQRDREVKAHEQAHVAAGGSYVKGGAKYEYEKGPDGKSYAVEGEVQIDTSKVPGDPEATLRKMQVIRNAALAPASPSAADRKIAAQATQKENQARMEILTQRYEEAAALRSDATETESGDSDVVNSNGQRPAISLGGLINLTQ
jgi:hypothetical protein